MLNKGLEVVPQKKLQRAKSGDLANYGTSPLMKLAAQGKSEKAAQLLKSATSVHIQQWSPLGWYDLQNQVA